MHRKKDACIISCAYTYTALALIFIHLNLLALLPPFHSSFFSRPLCPCYFFFWVKVGRARSFVSKLAVICSFEQQYKQSYVEKRVYGSVVIGDHWERDRYRPLKGERERSEYTAEKENTTHCHFSTYQEQANGRWNDACRKGHEWFKRERIYHKKHMNKQSFQERRERWEVCYGLFTPIHPSVHPFFHSNSSPFFFLCVPFFYFFCSWSCSCYYDRVKRVSEWAPGPFGDIILALHRINE